MRPVSEDKIYEITNKIQPPVNHDTAPIMSKQSLYVFFSIDICNSTKLKTELKNWFNANLMLYNVLFDSMHFWKYNGDEVLYSEHFSDLESLIDIVVKAYTYLKQLQNELCKEFGKSFRLKGTIWLAETGDGNDGMLCYHVKPTNTGDEFVGTDIDEGFRLAKKITGSKIVLDPKIVYYFLVMSSIYNNKEDYSWFTELDPIFQYARSIPGAVNRKLGNVISFISFVGFTKLKGIWQDRMYPVFWYYQSDNDQEYDEELDNIHVEPSRIKDNYAPMVLEKMFDAVNVGYNFRRILNSIAQGDYAYSYTLNTQSRLYYSVACINPESKHILIAKRSSGRNHLKGVWEFIPFKHRSMEIVNTIETEFKKTYGMNISLITDEEQEQNILPLHFCTTYRNGVGHNNLLCVAYFDNGYSDEDILSHLRKNINSAFYEDFAFVETSDVFTYKSLTRTEIESDSLKAWSKTNTAYPEKTATMYFEKSIKAISSFWDSYSRGGKWFNFHGKGDEVIE